MPHLLLEIFSEEIPARMQFEAAEQLRRLVTDALVERGLVYESAQAYATPRRLVLRVVGLPVRQADVREEKKGPRVGAPQAALDGFLKGAGLASLEAATVVKDDKKGDYYVAIVHKEGQETVAVLADLLPVLLQKFSWPKSMRWGSGDLKWVRPLHSIVCTFGSETEEPEVVPFKVGEVQSGNITSGHRFMAPASFPVRRFEDYVAALEKAYVVLDADRRKHIILEDARTLAFAQGLELIEDEGLLNEVAGLVEWPCVLMGRFDESFLEVPDEVIRTTIRANQKCFVVRDPKTGRLAPRFILVANVVASDNGAAIVSGNERVIRARLSDARFFWETDKKNSLSSRLDKLKGITFHAKLGTQAARVDRLCALATDIATALQADVEKVKLAASLAKADLVTEMVGEFPELQGLMGARYAALEGKPADVCAALEEHYKPQGPQDRVPAAQVSVAVALADKIDTLVGFWAIDEKPTGSKDPFALRRAALGVVRLLLENNLRLSLTQVMAGALRLLRNQRGDDFASDEALKDLRSFFADRLKVYLRDRGARHDLVDAVFALPHQDDLLLVAKRVEALGALLATDDGKNLLAGYRRSANILRAEEKKEGHFFSSQPKEILHSLLKEPEEKALLDVLESAHTQAMTHLASQNFEQAMRALALVRPAVDAFFDKVLVNAEDPALRAARLSLLATFRDAVHTVADFSVIEGS